MTRYRPLWLGGAGVICVASVACGLIAQTLSLPYLLAGSNLAVVAGLHADPHLLTAPLDGLIVRHCSFETACMHGWNFAAFAILAIVVGLAGNLAPRNPTNGAFSAAMVTLSVFAAGAILDPLGIAISADIALVALATIDLVAKRPASVFLQCALGVALALQDPLLAPAALTYAVLAARTRANIARLGPGACVVLAFAVRIWLAHPTLASILHPTLDAVAGPPTIVAFAACLFLAGPLLVLLSTFRSRLLAGVPVDTLVVIGVVAACVSLAGLFAPNGDPTTYWLAGVVVLVVGLIRTARPSIPFGLAFAAIVAAIAVQFAALLTYHHANPSVAIARASTSLRAFLYSAAGKRCISSDDSGRKHILADGAFVLLNAPHTNVEIESRVRSCLEALPDDGRLATIEGIQVTDWGRSVPLARAFDDSQAGTPLVVDAGRVTPHISAATPNGLGAFGNIVATPLGKVPDFTLLSGYSYTYPCVTAAAGGHLRFAVSTIPGTGALKFAIRVTTQNGPRTISRSEVPGTLTGSTYTWQAVSVRLPALNCGALSFSVFDPTGRRGVWMIFAGPAVR